MHLRKTYLSRAMSRAYSMDGPIGDPFGGPAYGERNDPVSAIVAFFEAATAFEAIAAVGAALSVVGMVTGNQDMMKIGGVMGLVGGFGTLAQNGAFGMGGDLQKWAQSTNSAFSSNASSISSAASAADAGATMVDGASASQVVDMSGGAAQAGLIEGGTDLNLAQAAGPASTVGINTTMTPGVDGVVAGPAGAGVTPGVDGVVTGPAAAGATPASGLIDAAAASPLDIAKLGEPVNAMSAAASQGGNLAQIKAASAGINTGASLWDKTLAFAEKNPTATALALKGVAGMYQSPADAALKEAQARSASSASNLYDARAAAETAQVANASAVPNVGGMRVNQNAQVYNPKPTVTAAGVRPAGLIQTRSM